MKFDALEVGLSLCGMFAIGYTFGDYQGSTKYAVEVREWEATCRPTSKAYVAYPVVKQGMLRGCYEVPVDGRDWKQMARFRRVPG